jgi:hypothetical protein
MVIQHRPGKWKFTHECATGRHSEGPFDSEGEAEKAFFKHKEKCSGGTITR